MSELPEPVSEKIRDLCAGGDRAGANGSGKLFRRLFYQVWLLLPKPQLYCEATGWIAAALLARASTRYCPFIVSLAPDISAAGAGA
jgi:hypothetical protein